MYGIKRNLRLLRYNISFSCLGLHTFRLKQYKAMTIVTIRVVKQTAVTTISTVGLVVQSSGSTSTATVPGPRVTGEEVPEVG